MFILQPLYNNWWNKNYEEYNVGEVLNNKYANKEGYPTIRMTDEWD